MVEEAPLVVPRDDSQSMASAFGTSQSSIRKEDVSEEDLVIPSYGESYGTPVLALLDIPVPSQNGRDFYQRLQANPPTQVVRIGEEEHEVARQAPLVQTFEQEEEEEEEDMVVSSTKKTAAIGINAAVARVNVLEEQKARFSGHPEFVKVFVAQLRKIYLSEYAATPLQMAELADNLLMVLDGGVFSAAGNNLVKKARAPAAKKETREPCLEDYASQTIHTCANKALKEKYAGEMARYNLTEEVANKALQEALLKKAVATRQAKDKKKLQQQQQL